MVTDIVARRPFSKSAFQVLYQTKADTFLITAVDRVVDSFFNSDVVTNAELAFFETYILPLEDHWNRQTLLAEILESSLDLLRERAAAYLDDSERKAAENTPWVDYVFGPLANNIRALSVQAGDNDLVERNKHIDQTILLAHVVKHPPLATYRDQIKLQAFNEIDRIKASMQDLAVKLRHLETPFNAPHKHVAQPALAPDSPLVNALQGITSSPDLRDEFSTSVLSLVLARLATDSFEVFIQALLDRVPRSRFSGHDSVLDKFAAGSAADKKEMDNDPICNRHEQGRSSKVRVLEEVEISTPKRRGKCGDGEENHVDATLLCDRQQAFKPLSSAKNIDDLVSTVDTLKATFVCKDADALQATYDALVAPTPDSEKNFFVVAVIDNLAARKFPYDIKLTCQIPSPKTALPFLCQVQLMDIQMARHSIRFAYYDRLSKSEGECARGHH